jgi:hypothetical protein
LTGQRKNTQRNSTNRAPQDWRDQIGIHGGISSEWSGGIVGIRRQIVEVVGKPILHGVVLNEREWSMLVLSDPHRNPLVLKLLAFRFHRRITPPPRDMAGRTPSRQEGQITFARRAD